MKNMLLEVMPKEIYVDYCRDCTTIWTDTKEVFVLNERDVVFVANQIRNLVSYMLICDETGDRMQMQNIKVYIDEVGEQLKDCLRNIGIECDDISSGAWLKRFCREQEEIYVDRKRFNLRKSMNK